MSEYIAYSYLRMTVYVNECLIKLSNDPKNQELINMLMIAVVTCGLDFCELNTTFACTEGGKPMKSYLNLIGEVFLDTQVAFEDVLIDNDIIQDFACCTQFVRKCLKTYDSQTFNKSEYYKRIMPTYKKYIPQMNEANQPICPNEQ